MRARRSSRGPLLLPLVMAAVGVILLLNNFLLLTGFNLAALWPLLLVIAGAQILLRGDLLPSTEVRTFAITRGSVESATLEISAGEIDVEAAALGSAGRLIAGQFAVDSRPELQVTDTHAHLKMDRSATPWYAFADWQVGLAPDLPWQLYVSASLGRIDLDLSGVVVQDAALATGIGEIRLVCPREALGSLFLRSALGDIHFVTPPGFRARVTVQGARIFRVHADGSRYEQYAPGVFESKDPDKNMPLVEVQIRGTFGDAYLT